MQNDDIEKELRNDVNELECMTMTNRETNANGYDVINICKT